MAKTGTDRGSELRDYRTLLEQRYAEVSSEYDNTIIALSGGALGVSFAFVKDLVPEPLPDSVWTLWLAWLFFGASLASILIAKLTSSYAIRHAISQVDDGTIESAAPGGWRAKATTGLNLVAAVTFAAGVVLLAYFARVNL